ncbi:MAG TPA: TIGR03435 family protein [Bryobacteraceae bacterium]|nr:TIGR03435 family protein [Bryobacteraceae bacterium]
MRFRLLCGFLTGVALFGADLPSFDVASIRPGSHPVTKEGYSISGTKRSDATHFRAVNCDLGELIEEAYGVRADRISGPGDVHSHDVTFDINATMPAETTDAQVKLMLQHLLAERFGVVLHIVAKPTSGYSLVVDRGGPHLKTSELPNRKAITAYGGSTTLRLVSPAGSMANLADAISRNIQTPVVDHTHLDELYDINFQFSRPGPVDGDAPTVFEAVKPLGLRLDKAQIPVESVVVDHANFKPVEN